MDRSIDRDDRTATPTPAGRPGVQRGQDRAEPRSQREREQDGEIARGRGAERYRVSLSERETMQDIGRFRVIKDLDLRQWRYAGQETRMREELRALAQQRLVQKKTVWTGRDHEKETFWALTKEGKTYLRRHDPTPGQAIYAGFVKPAELRHDAAIYVMYHREAARIAADHGRISRVVLDYELKKSAYSPLAKAKALPPAEYAKRQAEIAEAHGLRVVNGHIVLPDLRIEYETEDGRAQRVDLELATSSYHGSHAAEKAAAGLKMYAAPETAARLTAVLEEREITAEILWL